MPAIAVGLGVGHIGYCGEGAKLHVELGIGDPRHEASYRAPPSSAQRTAARQAVHELVESSWLLGSGSGNCSGGKAFSPSLNSGVPFGAATGSPQSLASAAVSGRSPKNRIILPIASFSSCFRPRRNCSYAASD